MFKLSLLCFDKSSDLFPSLSEFEIKFIFRHTQKQFFAMKSYFIKKSCLTVGSNNWQMMCLKIPRANRIEIDSIKNKYFSLSQQKLRGRRRNENDYLHWTIFTTFVNRKTTLIQNSLCSEMYCMLSKKRLIYSSNQLYTGTLRGVGLALSYISSNGTKLCRSC